MAGRPRPRPAELPRTRAWALGAHGLARGLPHLSVHAPLNLFGREVFDVRRDVPVVAEGVFDAARAVAVELILDGARQLRAGRDRGLSAGCGSPFRGTRLRARPASRR